MITGKIDLTKIPGAFVRELKGSTATKKCVIIPEGGLGLTVGEKGFYLDLAVFERKTPGTYGDTHFMKVSITKELRDAMTEEQRNAIPIIGNLKIEKPANPTMENIAAMMAPSTPAAPAGGQMFDDLPF